MHLSMITQLNNDFTSVH